MLFESNMKQLAEGRGSRQWVSACRGGGGRRMKRHPPRQEARSTGQRRVVIGGRGQAALFKVVGSLRCATSIRAAEQKKRRPVVGAGGTCVVGVEKRNSAAVIQCRRLRQLPQSPCAVRVRRLCRVPAVSAAVRVRGRSASRRTLSQGDGGGEFHVGRGRGGVLAGDLRQGAAGPGTAMRIG